MSMNAINDLEDLLGGCIAQLQKIDMQCGEG